MDQSSLTPSNGSPIPKSGSGSGPFAYQTRLLERTSSKGGGSLSRSNSQTSIITNPTGSSTSSTGTRRWIPSHRITNSLDAVRGKWEERARDTSDMTSSSILGGESSRIPSGGTSISPTSEYVPPVTPSNDLSRTPTYLKRRTMPAPIIASPLSPNTTGIVIETDSRTLSSGQVSSHRIHIPSTSSTSLYTVQGLNSPLGRQFPPEPSFRSQRSSTLDFASQPSTLSGRNDRDDISIKPPSKETPRLYGNSITSTPTPKRRPTSLYGAHGIHPPRAPSPEKFSHRPLSSSGLPSPMQNKIANPPIPASFSPSTSVMSPTPYRSSYMSSKKSATYGDNLIVGRKLGRHLPRIASGDGDEKFDDDKKIERREGERQSRDWNIDLPQSPDTSRQQDILRAGAPNTDDVAGLPGRLQLKAPSAPSSPLPSSILSRGLWADTQRHLIHAYEYLCHVGEAQQWIEGCLGEELEFGVVEMEDGLRNGVVLAKLVRAFQGEGAVRKIYEAPKLDFRHSDNINYFFIFVRQVGLPEGFIFELTDLYEKKNLPKVIYCIHALSHLLARRGMAERIGNLLGRLEFSDDQLQRTQKGLKDAGVAMPNFGNVGRELAKEINEEPEVEMETEDERRDRLLLEVEGSIVAMQALARGFLSRKSDSTLKGRIRLTERHIPKLQAQCRGFMTRIRLKQERQASASLIPWVISLQALARGIIVRKEWRSRLRQMRAAAKDIIKLQAQIRGILQRRRFYRLKTALRKSSPLVAKLQAVARARLTRSVRTEISKSFTQPFVGSSVIALQSQLRGVLLRRRVSKLSRHIMGFTSSFTSLQGHCRGVIMRRYMRMHLAKLEDNTDIVIHIQAAARTYLARKRLLSLIRGLRRATPILVGLQARARANLTRQKHTNLHKDLSEAKTIVSVGGFQALARASLARNRHRELRRTVGFTAPDVIGFQAAARGALLRRDYYAWRGHLHRSHSVATLLQAMLRGTLMRRSFQAKMEYYRTNLSKVVKIQSLFRAKETREQYRQLTLGKNVSVGTIKNFVHLLDDSEADFQEEIKIERLRKRVVEYIRENQALENDVSDLDVKIALVVQNVKSFEDLIKARRRHGADNAAAHAARASLLAAHGDPFSGPNTLDHTARRKLELYQQLFYLLQTRGEYLSHLFVCLSSETTSEKNRRFVERVVLTLFGYGQDRREDYLLLKLFQLAIKEEIDSASSLDEIINGHPMYINIAIHYVRPKQIIYAREAFQTIVREVVDASELDLEVDPSVIHKARIELEEMRSGVQSTKPKEVSFRDALKDPDTRPIYIRHLQVLQLWTEAFVTAIKQSIKKMPYGMRYLARETLAHSRERFPEAPEEVHAACIGRLVYYRYINPAIITPETFDIVSKTVHVAARKNLAQISKVLTQITTGYEFGDDSPIYVPINDFVKKAIGEISSWMIEVANVPDAETQFHAHEFLDATVQPKPIYISPNEIYTIHGLLSQFQDRLTLGDNDTLQVILVELNGVPHLGSEELKDARDTAITLELTNRFAHVRDPHAEEKTLWVQAKRGVLAILRVQPAQDLLESLMRPVTDDDELIWEEILETEMENEQIRHPRRQPSQAAGESAYRLEDIRSLKFAAVKALAISNLLDLEKHGKITREDGFQGILNAIAGDVRSKHRKRIQRQQEMASMNDALRHLAERKKYFEEQINSYHDYVETSMNTMQRGKGKKRFVLPFTKQYFHLRDLQKSGETPQFGSFLYTAKYLYEKGILLSIDKYSPRQFDKIQITMSSNTAGVFALVLESTMLGATTRIASEDVRMEDLLQAKYEKRPSLSLFQGKVKVNFDLFLYQINKKFYV